MARCSHLLRQGRFVADVLFYNGDGAPNFVSPKYVDPALGPGYDYDVCNSEILLTRLVVRDGKIELPDGITYRMLVLPQRKTMPVEVLRKIKELMSAGATVVGSKPEKDPGLTDYPQCDQVIHQLADEIWGNCDGKTVTEHLFGKGRIIVGKSLREILIGDNIPPDFEVSGKNPDTWLDFIHRKTDDAEIYFVANRRDREESATCAFRVEGKVPELWDPVTGATREANAYKIIGGRTSMPLEFAPYGSLFVLFRKSPAVAKTGTVNFEKLHPLMELPGPWTVAFDPEWGGPDSTQFEQLVSWSKRPEEGIKFYSGTARYRRTFDLPESPPVADRHVYLDLGAVKDVAEVTLNGKKLATLWTAPWRVEITESLQAKNNILEIAVTNLWPNRLIGDAALPPEKRRTRTNIPFDKNQPLLESGLLGPVRLLTPE